MKFEKHFPSEQLKPYIKYYVVSEHESENVYKVFPSSGLVIGFQYKGQLSNIQGNTENKLALSGISGISDSYKLFKNATDTGTVLVYFTEIGFTHFANHAAHDLFDLSLPLDEIFDRSSVAETEEKLQGATTDKHRIGVVEQFLMSQLKEIESDKLIAEAVSLIYQSKGNIRIKELNERLFISQSAFEKRFRKVVGTNAKKFASIVRFNGVLADLSVSKSLTVVGYENNYFDQAHLIKDFKQYTGDTPEKFKRFL